MRTETRTPGAGIGDAAAGRQCCYDVVVKQADVKVTGTGKTFINAIVEDSTGRIECIQWDPTEADVQVWTGAEVVLVRGKIGTYKDKPQITVQDLRALGNDEIEWRHVLPSSPCDFGWMKSHLESLTCTVSSPAIQDIIRGLTTTPQFLHGPAATFMHHAYIHGLVEHSLSVAGNALHYSGLGEVRQRGWNADVVVTAALLHDIGKVHEYTMTGKRLPAMKLRGHSLMGCEMIAQAIMLTTLTPEELEVMEHVEHIVASHHARPEWGAIVEPQTPEAWLVHCMDMADARMFAGSKRVSRS